MRAYTPNDVVLGEATSGTDAQRYGDMLGIWSAIANRANALGMSVDDIVSNPREFNSFGRALPPGANAYRSMVEQARQQVMTQGPVHSGMFYATPKASKNLPKGLQQVTTTKGHVFFSDPYNRAIGTAKGFKKPSMEAQQQLADLAGVSVPTPTARPDPSFQAAPVGAVQRGLLGDIPSQPAAPTGGLLSQNFDPNRFSGPSVTSFDPGRFAGPVDIGTLATADRPVKSPTAPNFDERFGPTIEVGQNKQILSDALNIQRGMLMAKHVPTYEDPYVTTDYAQTAPAPETQSYTPSAPVAAYAPQPAATPAVDAINTASTPAGLPAQQETFGQKIGGLLGMLGPAAIGGILGGIPGAIAGGLLGKQLTDPRNHYPSRPSKNSGPKAPSMSKGEIDAMHDRASRSPQARDAWSNGSSGLF